MGRNCGQQGQLYEDMAARRSLVVVVVVVGSSDVAGEPDVPLKAI